MDTGWLDEVKVGYLDLARLSETKGTKLPLTIEYTTSPDSPFYSQNVYSYDLTDFAARAGAVDGTGTSWMERVLVLPEYLPISFWWNADSAIGNEFRFYIDEDLKAAIEGSSDEGWRYFRYDLEAGTHTLRWAYEKTVEETVTGEPSPCLRRSAAFAESRNCRLALRTTTRSS